MKVWQIATGETGRDYSKLFFDHDIMIIGPSDHGDAKLNDYRRKNQPKIHSFANNPQPKDRVIMRFGKEVIGVGQIPAGDDNQYRFDETYNCVYGWDLCHCRRVIWTPKGYSLGKLSNIYKDTLTMKAFTQVHQPDIVELVSKIDKSNFKRELKKLPEVKASRYKEEELGVELFRAGISNKNINDIITALQQAERLYSWYKSDEHVEKEQCGRAPTEYEIVSHMILPLFLGLGWSHQQIAVEWNRIDMAFFKQTPTNKDACVMVLEAKGMGKPLSNILEQPKTYVKNLGLKNVRYILTTDGVNLFVYEKSRNQWDDNPAAYLNIWSVQKEYPLPPNTNAVDTLVRLQPTAI